MKNKYIVGIDLGGMSAKAAIFDGAGALLCKKTVKTSKEEGFEKTAEKLALLAKGVALDAGVDFSLVSSIGIASPGIIESSTGTVIRWTNYNWENAPLSKEVEKTAKKPVYVTNDANAAALGEARFGAGKNYKNSIFLTLGTGVGSGIILDGKLFEGYMGAGAEIGHMTIEADGVLCGCGKRGCFEKYASATALMTMTKELMDEDLNSLMWEHAQGKKENVDGRTAFECQKAGDKAADIVVKKYIHYLAVGISNLVNIFRPEAIILGGGVAGQGENLFAPLRVEVEKELYLPFSVVPMEITGASLGNDAGAYGAYSYALDNEKV